MAEKDLTKGSAGTRTKRYVFPEAERQRIRDIRQGRGPATKALEAGSTSPAVKRRATEEASAAEGGRLPKGEFERARKRAKNR